MRTRDLFFEYYLLPLYRSLFSPKLNMYFKIASYAPLLWISLHLCSFCQDGMPFFWICAPFSVSVSAGIVSISYLQHCIMRCYDFNSLLTLTSHHSPWQAHNNHQITHITSTAKKKGNNNNSTSNQQQTCIIAKTKQQNRTSINSKRKGNSNNSNTNKVIQATTKTAARNLLYEQHYNKIIK